MREPTIDRAATDSLSQPFPEATDAIMSYMKDNAPNEGCGFVIDGEFKPERNAHVDPENHFRIPADRYKKAYETGHLDAVVHSHCGSNEFPSKTDMITQVNMDVPWGLCVVKDEEVLPPIWWGDGIKPMGLICRPFIYGVYDCYSLCRDFYKINLDVTIPEFPREWDFWGKGLDMYTEGFAEAGFHQITEAEVKPGDAFLAQIRSDVPNHAGIYVGNGQVLHHLLDSVSRRDEVMKLQRSITHWVRFSERPDEWELKFK